MIKSGTILMLIVINTINYGGYAQITQDAYAKDTYFLLSFDKKTSSSDKAKLYKYQNRGFLQLQDVINAMRKELIKPERSPEWGSAKINGKKYRNGLDLSKPIAAKAGETFCFAVKTDALESIYLNGYITRSTPNFRTKDKQRELIIINLPRFTNNHFFNEEGVAKIQVYGYLKNEKRVYGTIVISKVSQHRYQEFMATTK